MNKRVRAVHARVATSSDEGSILLVIATLILIVVVLSIFISTAVFAVNKTRASRTFQLSNELLNHGTASALYALNSGAVSTSSGTPRGGGGCTSGTAPFNCVNGSTTTGGTKYEWKWSGVLTPNADCAANTTAGAPGTQFYGTGVMNVTVSGEASAANGTKYHRINCATLYRLNVSNANNLVAADKSNGGTKPNATYSISPESAAQFTVFGTKKVDLSGAGGGVSGSVGSDGAVTLNSGQYPTSGVELFNSGGNSGGGTTGRASAGTASCVLSGGGVCAPPAGNTLRLFSQQMVLDHSIGNKYYAANFVQCGTTWRAKDHVTPGGTATLSGNIGSVACYQNIIFDRPTMISANNVVVNQDVTFKNSATVVGGMEPTTLYVGGNVHLTKAGNIDKVAIYAPAASCKIGSSASFTLTGSLACQSVTVNSTSVSFDSMTGAFNNYTALMPPNCATNDGESCGPGPNSGAYYSQVWFPDENAIINEGG